LPHSKRTIVAAAFARAIPTFSNRMLSSPRKTVTAEADWLTPMPTLSAVVLNPSLPVRKLPWLRSSMPKRRLSEYSKYHPRAVPLYLTCMSSWLLKSVVTVLLTSLSVVMTLK
jgi:hypothetical protein